MSTTKTRTEEIIARAKTEILSDIKRKIIPAHPTSFAQLHDFVDANGYGGFFEDKNSDLLQANHINVVQNALDKWIKAGMPESILAAAKFYMDGLDVEFEGFTAGDRWNGWAVPYFTKEVAEAVLKGICEASLEEGYKYTGFDPKKDTFKWFDGQYKDSCKGEDIEGKHLYSVGGSNWCWNQVGD